MEDRSIRRLPVYLVLDTSSSMSGGPIEAVSAGLAQLLTDLRNDPHALETASLSIITFDSGAVQRVPLTDLVEFILPTLTAHGSTNLGGALSLLADCIKREVRETTPKQKGDYRPLVFLMTDGYPDAGYDEALSMFKRSCRANVICCAAGPSANVEVLRKISESVVMLGTAEPHNFTAFFAWVSSSVRATSQALTGEPGKPVDLPPPPFGMRVIP